MQEFYNFILDNIYLFCVLMAVCFVLIVLIVYLMKKDRREKREIDKSAKEVIVEQINKEELEKITDEEIEKRILDEYQQEQEEIIEEIKEEKEDNNSSSLDEIIKSLENAKKTEPSDALKKFEEEQEENAIISYRQLVESVKNNKIDIVDDEPYEKELLKNDAYKVETLEKYNILTEELEEEPIQEIKEERPLKYRKKEVISPVFGRMDTTDVMYKKDLEYTNNYGREKEEIKPVEKVTQRRERINVASRKMDAEEFLRNLKEFRRNL